MVDTYHLTVNDVAGGAVNDIAYYLSVTENHSFLT